MEYTDKENVEARQQYLELMFKYNISAADIVCYNHAHATYITFLKPKVKSIYEMNEIERLQYIKDFIEKGDQTGRYNK